MLGRAVATLAGVAGMTMVFGAGVASAAPGDLVTSFGTDGSVVSAFGSGSPAQSTSSSVAVAPNGDIYEAGSASGGGGELYVARYLPNGQVDSSFGTDGVVYENVGDGKSPWTARGTSSPFTPTGGSAFIAVTPSGEPVVLTDASTPSGATELAVLEFTQSGELDSAFNSNGVYKTNLGTSTFPGGLAVQADGGIVLTGYVQDGGGQDKFFALRLTATGQADIGFGTAGVEELQLSRSAYSVGTGVVAQSNGDLAFSASVEETSGFEFAITRLTANGQPDPSFGSGGTAYMQPNTGATPLSMPTGIVETPDGGYAVAGTVFDFSSSVTVDAVVTRFTAGGHVDPSFGDGGVFTIPSSVAPESAGTGIVAQGDGKLLLIGVGASSSASSAQPIIVRLDADGTLDSTFAAGGLASSAVPGSSYAFGTSAAQTPDGNLVLTGYAEDSSNRSSSFLQEFNLDSAPSVTFAYSPASVQVGEPVQFVASASGSDGESISGVSWDFGSGSFGAATGATVAHTFTAPGTYTVRVQATDSFGLSTISTQTIMVSAAPATPTAPTTTTTTTPTTTTTTTLSTTQSVSPALKAAPKLRLISIKVKHGKLIVKLGCAGAACKVTSGLTTLEHLISGKTASLSSGGHGKHTRSVKIGSLKLTLQAGQTHTFTIKLNRTGRKLLTAFKKIPATASFKLTNTKPAKTIHRKVRIH